MSDKYISLDNLKEYNKQMKETYIKPLEDRTDELEGRITIATFNITEANTANGKNVITFINLDGMTKINWGDGTVNSELSHTYSSAGEYTCKIYDVTSIGERAFQACYSLTSVVIGDSVTSIGSYAFTYCENLTSVVIPDSVTSIGEAAFNRCSSLASAVIPYGVTHVEVHTFAGCDSIMSMMFPNSITSIGNGVFSGCNNLLSVVIPDSVTNIGRYAFEACDSLTNVVIGDSVTNIQYGAFTCCNNLTSITIPDSVTSLERYSFSNCTNLRQVIFKSTIPILFYETIKESDSIKYGTFYQCPNLKYIYVPAGCYDAYYKKWQEDGASQAILDLIIESDEDRCALMSDVQKVEQLIQEAQKGSKKLIYITYSELKNLRDNAELIPGQFYRITDYECTTVQPNTKSAGHKFDIIVQALSENTLSETAQADYHMEDGKPDGYFNNAGGCSALNIEWCHTFGRGTYEGISPIFGEFGKAENWEGVEVPVLYKAETDDNDEILGVDYGDVYYYVDDYEFDGEVCNRWRLIEDGEDVDENFHLNNPAKKFILTNVVVENGEFDENLSPEDIEVWYTIYDDADCSYVGPGNHNDTFVEANYKENNDGEVVPVLYKTELNEYAEVDYEDTFYYVGRYEYQGETYDRWRKVESDEWDSTDQIHVLTNIIIEDGKFVSSVAASSGVVANIPAWEIKYCLDNDTSRFAWADATNGTGVIYYMKDEWGNEAPYDFKNIVFDIDLADKPTVASALGLEEYVHAFYTFSYVDGDTNEILDSTTLPLSYVDDAGDRNQDANNIIKSHSDGYHLRLPNNIIANLSLPYEHYSVGNIYFDYNTYNNIIVFRWGSNNIAVGRGIHDKDIIANEDDIVYESSAMTHIIL